MTTLKQSGKAKKAREIKIFSKYFINLPDF